MGKVINLEYIDHLRIVLKSSGGSYVATYYCYGDKRNRGQQIKRDYFELWHVNNHGMILIEVDEIGACTLYKGLTTSHFGINEFLKGLKV